MQWTIEAEEAIKKVPFFVRRKVRKQVEDEAAAAGKHNVALADVKTTQKRYLANMASEIKGYQLDACFGPSGCPNRSMPSEALVERLEQLLKTADLLNFLKRQVPGDLKFHHEFRVTVAECPNACSQPQIKDIGIIGAIRPAAGDTECNQCRQCAEICPDQAVAMAPDGESPVINDLACLLCGKCIAACPTETLVKAEQGYRVLLGGKLGRHPRLAVELPGIYDYDGVIAVVQRCIDFYKANSKKGRRFAELVSAEDIKMLTQMTRS